MWNIRNKNSGKLMAKLNEDGTFNEASSDLEPLALTPRDAEAFIARHGAVNFECVAVKAAAPKAAAKKAAK